MEKFATKDERFKDDWDTRFPHFDSQETGSAALEKAADEVEEYNTLLPIEYSLELRLKNINLALEKINPSTDLGVDTEHNRSIKKGKYGICEKCNNEIPLARLKAFPEAKICTTCQPSA